MIVGSTPPDVVTQAIVWHSEADTRAFAQQLAAHPALRHAFIELHGELGAGKTTLVRHLLHALGVHGRIKSPTYTLLEGYRTAMATPAWHLDLYRIADPGELEWLGLDALEDRAAVILVEWAERGIGALPAADMELHLDYADHGRKALLRACSACGSDILGQLDVPALQA